MEKKIDKLLVITTIVCLLPIIFGALVYGKLPEMVPSHWNFSGEVDDYMPKAYIAFGMPVMMAALNVVSHFVLNNDPKRKNAGKMVVLMGKLTVPVLCIFIVPISLLKGLDVNFPVEKFVPVLVGLLFILVGNYMPKCRQNYTVGIKLPWTLNSEENWNKTHRLAGKVWLLGGIFIMLCSVLARPGFLFFTVMVVVLFVPSVYSYCLYKKGI